MSNSRILYLEEMIAKASQSYYSGESDMEDDTFDAMVDELRELSPDSEVLKKVGWGFEPQGKKVSHRHGLHVGSLSKIHSVSEIPQNLRVSKVRITAKLDGLSVVSYYVNGERVLAVTRGNGSIGKDVTAKIDLISPKTHQLDSNFTGAVRGEVLIDQNTWRTRYPHFADDPSKNPRNVAAGVMNRDEVDEEHRNLRYVVYKVVASDFCPNEVVSLASLRNWLYDMGFDMVPMIYCESSEFTDEMFQNWYEEICKSFPCDGLVLSSDAVSYKNEVFDHTEVAYKFQAESKQVVVKEVSYTATRTGRMAPRVWFDPVDLSGAMVKKATAFNAQFIKDHRINVGTVLEVCRSGEVIPHILKVVTPSDTGYLPEKCPNCGGSLRWDGADLVCDQEKDLQLGYRFVSNVGAIDGAGWALYYSIVESLHLYNAHDVASFLNDYRHESRHQYWHDKVFQTVSGSVTRGKVEQILSKLVVEIDPVTFLVSMNIPGVSWISAETLLKGYSEFIDDVKECKVNYDRVYSIKGLGWSFVESLQSRENEIREVAEVARISDYVVKQEEEVQFKVAITGALSIKRAEFDAKLAERGIVQTSNFKECKYLITNNPDSTSSKMTKAKKYGVEVISEQEFTRLYL